MKETNETKETRNLLKQNKYVFDSKLTRLDIIIIFLQNFLNS